jgi:catechol 2,3-dioxygenase-like lactoylglutathione lyase family enzyme
VPATLDDEVTTRRKTVPVARPAVAVRTHGLTHLALAVRDAARSFRFYRQVFGMVAVYRRPGWIQAQTPGSRDVLVLDQSGAGPGTHGGVAHFGFRLVDPADLGAAARAVVRAGGRIESQGEFCPGEPYLFALDPDGYLFEVWFEPPTPVDPPALAAALGRRTRSRSGVTRAGSTPSRSRGGAARRR